MRLAILSSHPIQYYAPLFREISRRIALKVFFAHRATPAQQAAAGFGTAFEWDVDLLSGYEYEFLRNVARNAGTHHFGGCDTPEILTKLSRRRFDALLVTGWHLKSYWQGIWGARQSGLPVIVRGDSHLDTPRSAARRIMKRLSYPILLRAFSAALYVGQRNLLYLRHYGYPQESLFFSPHCVDNDYFSTRATVEVRTASRIRIGIPPYAPVALFAGKLLPFKRPLDVIHAAARARGEGLDLHVLVAGSGELQQEMRAEALTLRVPVHFLGFQNQSQMPAAYAAADFLVLPSNGRESWGLVANEAVACGCPIIVSDAVGCAPDLAADSEVGRNFPLGDIGALADSMMSVVRTPPLTDAIKKRSKLYSLNAAAQGIVAALEHVRA